MPDSKVTKNESMETQVALTYNEIKHLRKDFYEFKEEIKSDMVTRKEFDPVQRIVFAMVGLILVTVFGAIVALVIKQPTL